MFGQDLDRTLAVAGRLRAGQVMSTRAIQSIPIDLTPPWR
ncbi:hypothetical protein IW256_006192 [Actinomadura viridis]|uniref:Uncharacterized protein n=1 Tax=Actinomadura viridis TaxID=58110 RepID=A0A931DNW2_9ACTN|nr:hypothetical protein [Actinomadura viridis]